MGNIANNQGVRLRKRVRRGVRLERLEDRCLLTSDIIISEFVAKNETTLVDSAGDSPDWLELYNGSTEDVSLVGWYLTDDAEDLNKWAFPNTSIPANSFLVVFASDKDLRGDELHTNFKLTTDGEYLAITRVAGGSVEVVDEFRPEFPKQFEDISYGVTQQLQPNGEIANGELRFFEQPTPGGINPSSGKIGVLADEVAFSHERGFYDDDFSLTLSTQSQGTIRYTLDGSEPTTSNGTIYRRPVQIRETSVVRARAFQSGRDSTSVQTNTYFFLDDIVQQSPTGRAPDGFPTSRTISGQELDYGMDPDIVNDTEWGPQLADALTDVPSISLVMDVDDLLHSRTGIYTHAQERGRDWERPASLELIDADESLGFQAEAGVRIRGGFSRTDRNPKHAFRLFFREEYGDAKLEFPLFGDEGAGRFDKIDLRTTQNYSWSFQGDSRNAFVRDVFARDLQRELGQPYTRSRYYHLYINGNYWGLYQTQERAEARYAATYFGGDVSDYDVVKSAGNDGGYENEATDGTLDAYRRLASMFYQRGGLSTDVAYFRAQGMDADGTRNEDIERLLDVENLMDYVITTYFTGDRDGPASRFVNGVNNYFGIFNRAEPDGFKFFEHDSEHSLDTGFPDLAEQITSNGSQFRYFNPIWMHEQLVTSNETYELKFADRVFELTKPGGPLSYEKTQPLLAQRAGEIDLAIIAESARWGDAQRTSPFTKADWTQAIEGVDSFLVDRASELVHQFQGLGWLTDRAKPTVLVNELPRLGGPISQFDDVLLRPEDLIDYTQTVIGSGSTWKYLDDGSNQGSSWREQDFDDTSWRSGRARLGYGGDDEVTPVRSGPSENKHVTTYFRKTFDVTSSFDGLQLQLLRDDGAVVYLNGQEVVRTNMPDDFNYSTLANRTVSGSSESTFSRFDLEPELFRQRGNVLAVEVHQASRTSSDLSFDLALLGGRKRTTRQTVYYTLNGSDPKTPGGQIAASANRFSRSFSIPNSTLVRARSLGNGEWSPLTEVKFVVIDPDLEAIDDELLVVEGESTSELLNGESSVIWNDVGLQNTPLRVSQVSGPKYARRFQLNTDGTFEYEHTGSEEFADSFRYRVTDAEGKSAVATVSIRIEPSSDATPIAKPDRIRLREGTSTRMLATGRSSVIANDSGLVDGPVIVSVIRTPAHAKTFTLNEDGSFFYSHDGSETRLDSFRYRIEDNDGQTSEEEVSIAITAVSDAQPFARKDVIQVMEGGIATHLESGNTSVLDNDGGIVDSPFTVSVSVAPEYAAEFQLADDGTFFYAHDGSETQADYFVYQVRDFDGQTSNATVEIQIAPVNDIAPDAVDDAIEVREGGSVRSTSNGQQSLLANDTGLIDTPITISVVAAPQHARQFSVNSDGTFFYWHDGSEQFVDAFTYQIKDIDGELDTAEVEINIRPVSDARPLARSDRLNVSQLGASVELSTGQTTVLANDRSLTDGPVVVSLVRAPQFASQFTLNSDGTFFYQHSGVRQAQDSFRYEVTDNDGQTSAATVTIDVALDRLGDFDRDQRVDVADLDLIIEAVKRAGPEQAFEPIFDLDADGALDSDDIDLMITDVLQTRRGDADLDGEVGFADFLALSAAFGSEAASWKFGDFDHDGLITFADFLVLAANFGIMN